MKATNLLEVISNFGDINQNITFRQGNVVRTLAEGRNIIGRVEIDEEIPFDFGIYDASQLQRSLALVDDAEIEFKADHLIISGTDCSVKYFYTDAAMLTQVPDKEIQMPTPNVTFDLSANDLARLRKAAPILVSEKGRQRFIISEGSTEGKVKLSVKDGQLETANEFAIEVNGSVNDLDPYKTLAINIHNLKLMNGDYQVEVSDKLISKFTCTDRPITYWISLEKPNPNQ